MELRLVVDDREKLPYFTDGVEVYRLFHGDYSLQGYEHQVAIERKTVHDACESICGFRRHRFEKCIQRATSSLQYYAIVIEGSYDDLHHPERFYTQITSACLIGTYLKWSVKYNFPVFFAGCRQRGAEVVLHLLRGFLYYNKEPVS